MNAGEAAEERADREDTDSQRQTCYIIRASPSSVCVTQRVTAVLLCFLASHPRKLPVCDFSIYLPSAVSGTVTAEEFSDWMFLT